MLKKASKFLTLLAVLIGALWSLPSNMLAQTGNQAAIVIRFSDDVVATKCVEFEEPTISGFDLLQRSGMNIEIEAQGLGALVCQINDTGCSANDCLCQCSGGGECIYWSYWHKQENGWQYSQAGSTVYQVEPGSIDGWSWGPGAVNQAFPPPDISFEEVCQGPATDTPTPSPSPTFTNTPAPIIITPLSTQAPGDIATDTPLPITPTVTQTSLATIVPTETSTVSVSEAASPTRTSTETSTPVALPSVTQEIQASSSEAVTLIPPTEIVESVVAEAELQPILTSTPTDSAMEATAEPVMVAAEQMGQATSETVPLVAKKKEENAQIKAEPETEFKVIGADFVPPDDINDMSSQSSENDIAGLDPSDWLPYAAFLIIVGGLGVTLFIVSSRKKSRGSQ